MSMKELVDEIKGCVESEYNRAGDIHGPTNNSDHESYAIILEELQEAEEEQLYCSKALEKLWESIKANRGKVEKKPILRVIYNHALLAACEFIQVAAMAYKAIVTIESRKEQE